MNTIDKLKALSANRKSFILKRDNHESIEQGFLFSIGLFFITQHFGVPDRYDTYIYVLAFIILIVAVIQIGVINYTKIKEVKKNIE